MSIRTGDQLRDLFDGFWMKPHDLRMLEYIRRGYGVLLIINIVFLWLDRHRFYGPQSLVPKDVARAVVDPDTFNLYTFLPNHPLTITLTLASLAICALCLITSIYPRFAAALTLILLTWVHHANVMLIDAEDTVFRLFAFFFIFVPSWSALNHVTNSSPAENTASQPPQRGQEGAEQHAYPAWPLRLFQIQVCIIYLAAGIQKTNGAEWIDGTAVYYALRLDDLTLFHLPQFITENIAWSRILSWGTVAFELCFPFLVWNRMLRWPFLLLAASFHVMAAYSLNLHLFHPIMILGLLSFVRYEEWQAAANRLYRLTRGPIKSAAASTQS